MSNIKYCLQIIIVVAFIMLAIIGGIEKDWSYGLSLNLTLSFIYFIIYFKPF